MVKMALSEPARPTGNMLNSIPERRLPERAGWDLLMLRRRDFISTLGGAVVAWPLAARGQQPATLPTIGLLGANTAATQSKWNIAFAQRLNEHGWVEGRNVNIEYRWAEGRNERFAEIAAEFVRLKVAVIVTSGTAPVIAAKQATSVIPIVFATAGDPVGNGLVASLARPGGNVTGLSLQTIDLAGKRLELLREVLPGLRGLAIMANVGSPIAIAEIGEVQVAARTLGLEVDALEIRRAEDIPLAFEALKRDVGALYVQADPLTTSNRTRINNLALAAHLPTMHGNTENVEAGGLMAYAPPFPNLWQRAADFVDKILRGTKPGDIPVEQPTKFELVINLKTAKALGITFPQNILATADEVIE
jgi:putative ABC transport system substrate-binding protein